MKAIAIEAFGAPENFREIEAEAPQPLHNDVLVKVHALGLNPFDTKMRVGKLQPFFNLPLPLVIGWDVAGEVLGTGFDVYEFAPGDRVYGMASPVRWGGAAEQLCVGVESLRPIPEGMSFAEAAVIPMAGQTAWHALVTLADVGPGDRVLVQAAAGGVGAFAVQVAKARGAWVAGTCSTRNVDFVRDLGADEVIDYTRQDFTRELSDIDYVLDVLGGDVIVDSYKVMKRGGKILAVLRYDPRDMETREQLTAEYGVTVETVVFANKPHYLDELAALYADGRLRIPLTDTVDFSAEALAAAHRQLESGHTRGKLAMRVVP
jgi:NADPH:quinone reductase-like Zn-dependent oxidoreductase